MRSTHSLPRESRQLTQSNPLDAAADSRSGATCISGLDDRDGQRKDWASRSCVPGGYGTGTGTVEKKGRYFDPYTARFSVTRLLGENALFIG